MNDIHWWCRFLSCTHGWKIHREGAMLLSLDRWKFLGTISVRDDLAISSVRGSQFNP